MRQRAGTTKPRKLETAPILGAPAQVVLPSASVAPVLAGVPSAQGHVQPVDQPSVNEEGRTRAMVWDGFSLSSEEESHGDQDQHPAQWSVPGGRRARIGRRQRQ